MRSFMERRIAVVWEDTTRTTSKNILAKQKMSFSSAETIIIAVILFSVVNPRVAVPLKNGSEIISGEQENNGKPLAEATPLNTSADVSPRSHPTGDTEPSNSSLNNEIVANTSDSQNETTSKLTRSGRVMNLDSFNYPYQSHYDNNYNYNYNYEKKFRQSSTTTTPAPATRFKLTDIQDRILNGHPPSSYDSFPNSFLADPYQKSPMRNQMGFINVPVTDKMTTAMSSQSPVRKAASADIYSTSLSYSNPDTGVATGIEPSELLPYYDRYPTASYAKEPVLYQLVPVRPTPSPYTFSDAFKDTIFHLKDGVTGTVQKVKNVLGFNGFAEKVATPDTLLAVAPVAAGLLAGGLAVAYFASKQTKNNTLTIPNIFGKRSVRDLISEEDLNHIVSRLNPMQREYLQKLQFYGPQRWKDVTCAKYIFCDVMSKASPLHVLDMQRKIGIFLSRMDERTARYVEVILKDVMLAIQARDCTRFSCSQASWGLPHPPPQRPFHPPMIGHPPPHPFNGQNFLRRQ